MKQEVFIEPDNRLSVIIKDSGLEQTKADYMMEKFKFFFQTAAEWERKAELCRVTSREQTAEMKMAREGRLFLKGKRVEVEKARKELKEQSLREGKAIDGIANVLKALIVPIEEKLEGYEKFAEIEDERIAEENRTKRAALLEPYGVDIAAFNLGTMTEETFTSMYEMTKKSHKERIAAEKRAEEERIARERAEAEAREQQRIENERLKKEAEEMEAQMKKEREEAERKMAEERAKAEAERKSVEEKAKKEREELEQKAAEERARQEEELRKAHEEKARVEAEVRAKKEAEERAQREKAEAEKRKQNAPDKEKLYLLSSSISAIQLPEVRGEEAAKIVEGARQLLAKAAKYISENTDKL